MHSAFAKEHNVSLDAEFLYFKISENSLSYAQKIPQDATYQPRVHKIDQIFTWDPGARASLNYYNAVNKWEFSGTWSYFHTNPPEVKYEDANNGVSASLLLPAYGVDGNYLAKEMNANWNLTINAIDITFKRLFFLRSVQLYFYPVFGLKGAFIRQNLSVKYNDILVQFTRDNTPQKVTAENSFQGGGITVGAEAIYKLPQQFEIFLRFYMSGLQGRFETTTTYSELLDVPHGSLIEIRTNKYKAAYIKELRLGIEREFAVLGKLPLKIGVGYEVQFWEKLTEFNWFSTFVTPAQGSEITIHGFFAKASLFF